MARSVFFRRPTAAVAAFSVAVALGAVGLGVSAAQNSSSNPPATIKLADRNEGPSRNGFAPVIKQVLPAVVSVASTKVEKVSQRNSQMDPLFRQFFGDNPGFNLAPGDDTPGEHRSEGLGSGVVISPQGYILTNNHVVDGATTVTVKLSDQREFKARVIGTDPNTDIAVIKIDAGNLPAITVGDSDKVEIGDYAIAVGNPFGVGQTVTMGIVSATHRGVGGQIENYEDFIQTDAAINPGNSGGALVNDRGELVGINTAIIAHGSEGNQGIGFAVPVNLARNVMDQLIKNGKVTRAYLGIALQDVTPAIAKQFGRSPGGALVDDVSPNTPAARAGIERGDIIMDVNGKPIFDVNQLRNTISTMDPNAHVNLKVIRNGSEKNLAATLSEYPSEEAQSQGKGRRGNGDNASESVLAGVTVGESGNGNGVVVTRVSPNSAAAEAGLREGDVIQEVNRQPVKNVADFRRAVGGSHEGNLLLVNREGRTVYVAV